MFLLAARDYVILLKFTLTILCINLHLLHHVFIVFIGR